MEEHVNNGHSWKLQSSNTLHYFFFSDPSFSFLSEYYIKELKKTVQYKNLQGENIKMSSDQIKFINDNISIIDDEQDEKYNRIKSLSAWWKKSQSSIDTNLNGIDTFHGSSSQNTEASMEMLQPNSKIVK